MEKDKDYRVFFFAGGETRDDHFNVFTGSFINSLSKIMDKNFFLIKGIYFKYPVFNVIWGLNNGQKPISDPAKNKITSSALMQLLPENKNCESTIIILSSSSGSIVAAQTACYLAAENILHRYYINPVHLVLGTTFISKESDLYKKLLEYQRSGMLGTIIFDELQDEGDSIYGAAGRSRAEAWSNAVGLIMPWISKKYMAPSFLNTDPEKGHLHRRRSQTVQKAIDFIEIIFIRNNLAGEYYREKALSVLENKKNKIIQSINVSST
jgi:hypothetical protein